MLYSFFSGDMPKEMLGFPVIESIISIDTSGLSMDRNALIFSNIFLTGKDSLKDFSKAFINRFIIEFESLTPNKSTKNTKDFL